MLGRGLGGPEQGLDLLAGVAPGPAFDAAQVLFRLSPALPKLTGLIFIALAWDDARAQLLAAVREKGLGARALLVSDAARESPAPEVAVVPLATIRDATAGGAGLSL